MSAQGPLESRIPAIYRLLEDGGPDNLGLALELAEQFPFPQDSGVHVADQLAKAVFDAAFAGEGLMDYRRCVALYRRVVACPVTDSNILAGAWFRMGHCLERVFDLHAADEAYEAAIQTAQNWERLTSLALWHLAELRLASEDYGGALALLDQCLARETQPDVSRRQVRLRRGVCLERENQTGDAKTEFLALIDEDEHDEIAAHTLHKLASMTEAEGDFKAAAGFYARLIAHPHSPNEWKFAAAHRATAIGKA